MREKQKFSQNNLSLTAEETSSRRDSTFSILTDSFPRVPVAGVIEKRSDRRARRKKWLSLARRRRSHKASTRYSPSDGLRSAQHHAATAAANSAGNARDYQSFRVRQMPDRDGVKKEVEHLSPA